MGPKGHLDGVQLTKYKNDGALINTYFLCKAPTSDETDVSLLAMINLLMLLNCLLVIFVIITN